MSPRRSHPVFSGAAAVALTAATLGAACSRRDRAAPTQEASPAPSAVVAGAAAPSSAAPVAPPGPTAPVGGEVIAVDTSPAALAAADEPLTLMAGGDVCLGREQGQAILRDPAYDPLGDLQAVFSRADLRFVNLESQLSDQRGETQSPSQRLKFTGPPGGGFTLKQAGVEVVSLANNHLWDYGKGAFFETLANLERAGVAYAGAAREPGQQYRPAVVRVKGRSVAVFAVTEIWNQGDFREHPGRHHVAWAATPHLLPALRAARREHDFVIVSYHGGAEYVGKPMEWTREFVRAVMYAGADAFIGHHPHVPQGVAWFEGRPAFYSLGNLVFGMHRDHPWTGTGYLVRLTLKRGSEPGVELCPYHILGHRPRPFTGKAAGAQQRQFERHLVSISRGERGGLALGPPDEHGCRAAQGQRHVPLPPGVGGASPER